MSNATLARTPAEWPEVFAHNFNKADLEALLASYTEDAVLDVGGANILRGRDQIRLGLQNFLAAGLPIGIKLHRILESGNTAIVMFAWSISGQAPDGSKVEMGGNGIDVLQRGADGFWRQLLDTPFGSATPA